MKTFALPLSVIAAGLAGSAWAADPATIDWSRVPAKSLTLFYPGQSTYQWLRSPAHQGSAVVAYGTPCVSCHKGQEAKLGDKIVKGGPLEPTPVGGKNGSLQLNLQVAYDPEYAYFRFGWKTQSPHPGDAYPFYRFDGKEWKPYGAQKLAASARKGEQPGIYEDRLSMMIGDGKVPAYSAQGCWITCHNGERDAPNQPSAAEVKASAFFQAIKKSDVRKYLPATRTDAAASWDRGRSLEEIAKLKSDGVFLDLIQWRAHRSNPVGMADDGYVLEWRNFDAGKNPFASNIDAGTKQPKFMYDEKKVGKKALRIEDLNKIASVMVPGQTAVAFDPNAGWKEGDLVSQYVVSREAAAGSAADNADAKGVWKDGTWTVLWARKLNLANDDDKALREGTAYPFSFAVHDDNVTSRGHFVSFPTTIGFGAKADIQATKLK
ncbi:MAG TPA: ethylbenzene dehydrogenase-related protein [Burkholderiales bacterium]|nr:ethylbenzene dehydrogenase-related protein [Burkholderiales bacterium]